MRYRTLGRSGLRISVLGLGCSGLGTRVTGPEAEHLIRSAMDAGINFFDTADVYGRGASEEALGRSLRGVRDKAVVATKVRWAVGQGPNDRGASRIHIRAAAEASLRRMGTDRIDLYQIHAPDPATPVDETLAAMDALVSSGKVLYVGTSNFAGWQVADAHWQAAQIRGAQPISTQAPYSLLDAGAEQELLPAVRYLGIGFIACLVLARGYLAGAFGDDADRASLTARQRAYLTPVNRLRRQRAADFAARHETDLASVALRAIADAPGVTAVLSGASNVRQIAHNAKALSVPLQAEHVDDLMSIARRADAEPADAELALSPDEGFK